MPLLESELWYWRYCTETIHQVGNGIPRYQLVKYEELNRGPLKVSRSIYRFCGLDWNDAIGHGVQQLSSQLQPFASAWRDRLSVEQIALVERMLGDSAMRDWWD